MSCRVRAVREFGSTVLISPFSVGTQAVKFQGLASIMQLYGQRKQSVLFNKGCCTCLFINMTVTEPGRHREKFSDFSSLSKLQWIQPRWKSLKVWPAHACKHMCACVHTHMHLHKWKESNYSRIKPQHKIGKLTIDPVLFKALCVH